MTAKTYFPSRSVQNAPTVAKSCSPGGLALEQREDSPKAIKFTILRDHRESELCVIVVEVLSDERALGELPPFGGREHVGGGGRDPVGHLCNTTVALKYN